VVGVRPEHVVVSAIDDRAGAPADGRERGEIVAVEPLGAETHLVVRAGDVELRAQSPGFDPRRRGDAVGIRIDPARALVFDAEGEGARVGG
jgi:multiple sugar transport system ATP-binding protein